MMRREKGSGLAATGRLKKARVVNWDLGDKEAFHKKNWVCPADKEGGSQAKKLEGFVSA